MKTEKNILIAFILNITFSIIEFLGGIITNSVAIYSDAIHDLGDALSIGVSYFLERKSKTKANNKYTYGYVRYSVLGAVITTTILLVGSILVITNSIKRLFNPVPIDYSKMILFSIIGIILNLIAAHVTKEGDSINQKAVNLHMLEDVLGWIIVFIGAIIMNFTNINIIDSLMSIGVSLFILINSLKNLLKIIDVFLEKTPNNIDIDKLKDKLLKIDNIENIHHIHIWSIDGYKNLATMHIVTTSNNSAKVKKEVRKLLEDYNICHAILETEDTICDDIECNINLEHSHHHHHHH